MQDPERRHPGAVTGIVSAGAITNVPPRPEQALRVQRVQAGVQHRDPRAGILTAHLKNGWLPRATHGWRIHSIGCFTGRGGGYSIAVLTQDNASMAYGVATVEAIARVINRDLNAGITAPTPSSLFRRGVDRGPTRTHRLPRPSPGASPSR